MIAQRGSAHFAKRSYADTKADQVQPGPWHQWATNKEGYGGFGTQLTAPNLRLRTALFVNLPVKRSFQWS